MRTRRWIELSTVVIGIGAGFPFVVAPALAQYEPVIVVPGRAGVPVMMNGLDIAWSVVEGDWGLARPGQVSPTLIYRLDSQALIGWAPGGYYPATGRAPRYGRLEVDMPPRRQTPAETYYRTWSSQSGLEPASVYPPYDPPPVILAPPANRHRPGATVNPIGR